MMHLYNSRQRYLLENTEDFGVGRAGPAVEAYMRDRDTLMS
jgi:hypothetical protein